MSLQKRVANEISRRTQVFYAKRSSYSLGTGNVQIELDVAQEFIDFQNSRSHLSPFREFSQPSRPP